MPRQWSLWQKTPETFSAKSCVTPEALGCSGSDPDGTHTDAGSRPGDPSALTPNGFSLPSSPSFPGEADPKVATSAWTLALQPSWLVAELIQKGTIIPQSATQTSREI